MVVQKTGEECALSDSQAARAHETEGRTMKLSPIEAPLYGKCVLTVLLEDDDAVPEEEEEGELVEFYLLFSGSSQRHLTSTVRVGRVTLQAVCPGHNEYEQVLVVLCVARPDGAVDKRGQNKLTFVQDLALDTAHVMLNSKLHQKDQLWNDPKECIELEESLVLALKHLTQLHRLGPCSSALTHTHPARDTLHTAPMDNHQNITQESSAESSPDKGTAASSQCNSSTRQQQLSGLNRRSSFTLGQTDTHQGSSTECESSSQDHLQRFLPCAHSDTGELHIDPDGQVFQHHSKLGTFSLTLQCVHKWQSKDGSDFCLQDDVAQLRRHITQHKGKKENNFATNSAIVTSPLNEERVISHHNEATEQTETMGQDQSLIFSETDSEKLASPQVDEGIQGTTVSEEADCDRGDTSDEVKKEEPESLSIWYDCEQLGTSTETDSPQLPLELCVSPPQLSPAPTQPHATGLQPEVSHGSASQRQEVLGAQRDKEAGPDWEKASGEEVGAHSKKSSENEEDGHGDRSTKFRKKKKKRGKRGGPERKQLSSTSSVESQNQTETLMQLTDWNIEEKSGTDIPTISLPGTSTMQLPNQAEIQNSAKDEMRRKESQIEEFAAKVTVVWEIKEASVERLDEDIVEEWKERERVKREDKEQTEAGTCSTEWEEQGSKRSVGDCLQDPQIQRETDFGPVHCADPSSQTDIPRDNKSEPLVCLQEEEDVSPETNTEDGVFKGCDRDQKVRVSWSSTDDASSVLGTYSEEPSISISDPSNSRLSWKSEAEDTGLGEMEGGEEEERKDQLPENIVSSAILRATRHRSLSPSRRHSWEPARNEASDMNSGQSSPFKSLSEDSKPAKTSVHRRSMSWCPSNLASPEPEPIDNRSYSLEGLVEVEQGPLPGSGLREKGALETTGCYSEDGPQPCHQVLAMTSSCPGMFQYQTLTKSVSMIAISHREIDGTGSFTSNPSPVEFSISEEEPGPLRSTTEGKGGPRISRTFSYLRNKMIKKGKEKEKDRKGEKEREPKEKDKKSSHSHMFVTICPPASSGCQHCNKPLQTKECLYCSNCGMHVHKSCKDAVATCAKSKNKLQVMVPDAAPSAANGRTKSTSSTGSTVSSLSSSSRERWSTVTTPEDQFPSVQAKRSSSIFSAHSNLSKSISISNIAGLDEVTLKGLKLRSQSTDSLNQNSAVNASTESLTDEGTEMMDTQLMGEFESDIKDLEADSWSGTVDKKFLKTLKKDEIKRQDVIYELYQTEFHHVRTLRIMSEVYYKGIQKELQLDLHTLEKIFPVLDDLVETHTEFLNQLLEQRRGPSVDSSLLVCSIGDVLVKQFSGSCAERMKKVYGKFCSRHNEAVTHYKDLYAKDKRFQNFIKKVMSSTIVRRLSIPECILLVTQRITKYPVLIQRILQHTKETDLEHASVSEALQLVKEILTAVDSKVNEQEKKHRLKEVYSRTDSKSIMRMKSGQMFAKEDLVRGRRLLHDGVLQLKNAAGRLKEVHSLLLSDVLVFLQEKDQKYVFASLDQRSTVISLQNLIMREVANEERGLFLITAGTEKPEMVEVLASSKEERNTWRAIIQDAMHCMEKDEDEGIPSETEEDRRQQESRVKEIRELLRSKDEQIVSLLEEKVHIFRELSDCSASGFDAYPAVRERMLFRATPEDFTKGEPIIHDALKEVESLHSLVNTGLGGAACSVAIGPAGGSMGPVCLPRRAETFGGFDSHQMNISKNGEKEEADESVDLRRTESDGVLKKGATASLQLLLKRNNEQVQSSVTHLHDLLLSLQAVVVQQDSFIEDQRQTLSERLTGSSSRHSSSSSLSSASSSRPSSLIEQEKHRSLERQRQEAATLQKQQAAHLEEKRRREREWEVKERLLCEREEQLKEAEEQTERRLQQLKEDREQLQRSREQYHKDLERVREAQLRLERDKDTLRRDTERLEAQRREQAEQLQRYSRTSSMTSEDSVRFPSTSSLDLDCKEAEQSKEVELSTSAPTKEPFLRIGSKRMGKNFNPFASSSKTQGAEKETSRLLQLTKPKKDKKDKKDKKKKKGEPPPTGTGGVMSSLQKDGDNFC
uniref:A-kinase anchor protein 13-like n=1 Tax=Knipowitschia caucasica TaxID=637954 RepID=A0AAV2L501_KNICA